MPVDRGAIDAQLRAIGEGERWWEEREFRDLPYVLHVDEQIRGLVTGKVIGARRPRLRAGGRWLLVATDQRLIALRQEGFGRKQLELAAGQITRIQERYLIRSYQLTLDTPVKRYRIRIAKADAFRFSEALAPLAASGGTAPRLHPDLEALAWIPGIRTVAALPVMSGIISKVSMISAQGYPAQGGTAHLEEAVERLQQDVEKLQQQVAFLEDLLQRRSAELTLPGATSAERDKAW